MPIKILHTGDVHLGMAFSHYPDTMQAELMQARITALEKLVREANRQSCQLFIIAGDLFHSTAPGAELRGQARDILQGFAGVTAILPGNHDYDNGITDLWMDIKRDWSDKILILNENRVYSLDDFGMEVDLYPAVCDCRRSATNRLGWLYDIEINSTRLGIGIAHGAVEGLSPEYQGAYFYMTREELDTIPVDLWLLGHAHTCYPDQLRLENPHLLVCGTPEPEGINSSQEGNAWIIDASKEYIEANAFNSASFCFREFALTINNEADLLGLEQDINRVNPEHSLVRLILNGSLEPEVYSKLPLFYQRWQENLYYLDIEDHIGLRLNSRFVDQQFIKDSFPHRLLSSLIDDPAALRVAYELVGRAKP